MSGGGPSWGERSARQQAFQGYDKGNVTWPGNEGLGMHQWAQAAVSGTDNTENTTLGRRDGTVDTNTDSDPDAVTIKDDLGDRREKDAERKWYEKEMERQMRVQQRNDKMGRK